jgi:DNA-binding NtrC family response regulator
MERVLTQRRVLLVDPSDAGVLALQRACQLIAEVEFTSEFAVARKRLLQSPPDILATNLRLGAYNGLHLVYLARTTTPKSRAIVYSSYLDLPLIEEAQSIGAFFEPLQRLQFALPAYVRALLPARDRRSPLVIDRRKLFRGGRRSADISVATT